LSLADIVSPISKHTDTHRSLEALTLRIHAPMVQITEVIIDSGGKHPPSGFTRTTITMEFDISGTYVKNSGAGHPILRARK